jgi:hypothetical protein
MKINYNNIKYDQSGTDVSKEEFGLMVDCILENNLKTYLEVGVWHGYTLYNMLNLFKDINYNIDATAYDCFIDGVIGENSHTSGWPDINIAKNLLKTHHNVEFIIGDSCVIDKKISNKKFDFVFHDANHTKDAIIDDLIVLKNVIHKDSYVAVHNSDVDYPDRNFYGKSAIDFLIKNNYYKFLKVAGCSTLLKNV